MQAAIPTETALNNHFQVYEMVIPIISSHSLQDALNSTEDFIQTNCRNNSIYDQKCNVSLLVEMKRDSEGSVVEFYLNTKSVFMADFNFNEVKLELSEKMETFCKLSSNFRLNAVKTLRLKVFRASRIPYHVGHGYFPLPRELSNKKAVVNVENSNQSNCFLYAILSALYHEEIVSNQQRMSKYDVFLNKVNMEGIQLPFNTSQLSRFHKINPQLAVNILEWTSNGAKMLVPAPLDEKRKIVNILLVENEKNYHFVGITNLNRLINKKGYHRFYCHRCLQPFCTEEKLNQHMEDCKKNIIQSVKMPTEQRFKFKNFGANVNPPVIVYSDIESIITDTNEHIPIAIGYFIKIDKRLSSHPPPNIPLFQIFTGKLCIPLYLQRLKEIGLELIKFNENYTRKIMNFTSTDHLNHREKKECYLCYKPFTTDIQKVRDHCHFEGKYLGAACSKCNLQRAIKRNTIPIIFHNARGYDNHHLMKYGFGEFPELNVKVISTSMETYMNISFKVDDSDKSINLNIIDSCLFLNSSLAQLVSIVKHFINTDTFFPNISRRIKYGKGIFPYSYLNNEQKLKEKHLPSIDAFYDKLKEKSCTVEDYELAQ